MGGIGVIAEFLIGIAQIIPSYYERKEESKKREKMNEQLKKNLVEILDLSKALEGSSPDEENLFDLRTWKLIKLRSKVLSNIVIGSMTLLDMKLIHHTLEYLNYLNEQFENADKKQKVRYIWFTKHTKSFLDKFFPEHVEERRVFLENLEKQAKWAEMEHEKAMAEQLEWYEQNYEPELYSDDLSEIEDPKDNKKSDKD